ncbi:MAG: hypothetical protein QW359_07935 [Metallosphaera sp.]
MTSPISEDEKKLLIDLVELLEDAVGNLSHAIALIERAKEKGTIKSDEVSIELNSLSIYARDYSFNLLSYVEKLGKVLTSTSEVKVPHSVSGVEGEVSGTQKEEGE